MWLIAIYFENESLSIFATHICLVVKKRHVWTYLSRSTDQLEVASLA